AGTQHARARTGNLAGEWFCDLAGALEHPGATNPDGAKQPEPDAVPIRRPALDRWLGWLSGGAPAPVRRYRAAPAGQSAGAARRRAYLLRRQPEARFLSAPFTHEPGACNRILRHLGHPRLAAA